MSHRIISRFPWAGRLRRGRWAFLCVLGLAVVGGYIFFYPQPGSAPRVDFNAEVRPILNSRCIGCHGGVRQSGGFSVQFREEALRPAKSGRLAIVPGSPGESELLRRVSLPAGDPEFMPKRGAALTKAEVQTLRRWIDQGGRWDDYWAYVAPIPAAVPAVRNTGWAKDPLDSFVLARLEQAGLAPAPRADCAHLMRRVSLDLIGLPPAFADTQRFCADAGQQAYAREVERLLASPQFGERWASMWLDLARYADSNGYEIDKARVIWEYRDWVIRAFNRDLPFDEFTIEQLAGDLLPDPDADQLIATAYHRNTSSAEDQEEFRVEAVIDRVANTWEVWQGQTMGCARCHSHTYDPFRQVDFYRLMAFFNNTDDADTVWGHRTKDVPESQAVEWPAYNRFAAADAAEGARLVAERDSIRAAMLAASERPDVVESRRQWEKEHLRYVVEHPEVDVNEENVGGFASLEEGYPKLDMSAIVERAPAERTPNDWRRLADFYAEEIAPQFAAERKRLREITHRILALKPVQTPIMQERPAAARRATHFLIRGGWRSPDLEQPVQPDVPGSMPPLSAGQRRDRLGLARWLVDDRNPLTARVTVNRFWAQLFGHGIVPSVGNFGTQGDKPDDQALLDSLAIRFRTEMRWSMKNLLRAVVLSATYQQSSAAEPARYASDPRNQALARGPRVRLSAEAIRDQALAVSGLLNPKQFGPPVVFPTKADLQYGVGNEDEASKGDDRYRRAIYGVARRSNFNPSLNNFDHPIRVVATSERRITNSPLQALITLNEPAFVEASDALAKGMAAAGPAPAAQVAWAYRQILARDPTDAELGRLTAIYDDAQKSARDPSGPQLARRVVANVLLNLDSVLTKE